MNDDLDDPESGLFNFDKKQRDSALMVRLRGYLLTGILVTAPIFITFYVTLVFLRFMDKIVAGLLPEFWYNNVYQNITFPGSGLVMAIGFFILVGWSARNFLGRIIISMSEYALDKMPIIRTIYSAIKQVFETIMASQSAAFRDVVMLEYPRKGVWSIGFVTGETKGETQRVTNSDTVNVFVPTTPNPTSGYLLFVPKKELVYLDMTVEEGVKLVVSAGIISPPDRGIPEKPAKKTSAPKKARTTTQKKSASKAAVKKKPATKKKTGSKSS